MHNGLKLIVTGLVLSHEERKNKIELLNEMIDSVADTIRSSSDVDGMPHGSSVGDVVGIRVQKMERYENERDLEQERVNAVEWGYQYIADMFSDKDAPYIREAINLVYHRKYNEANILIREKTDITPSSFRRAKSIFIKQVLTYLRLQI